MDFVSRGPILPLDSYDGESPIGGVINGVEVFSSQRYTDYPLSLCNESGGLVAKLIENKDGWGISFHFDTVVEVAPPQRVYLEFLTPVPLPLEYLGITEMQIDDITYDVSVDGTRLVLTSRKPA